MFAVKLLLISAKTMKRAIKRIPGGIRSVRIRKFIETAKKRLKRNPGRSIRKTGYELDWRKRIYGYNHT